MIAFGLIETIKVVNGKLVFKNLHVKRLCNSLKILGINESETNIEDAILSILKNECFKKSFKNFRFRIEIQKNNSMEFRPEIAALKWSCTLKSLENKKYVWNKIGMQLTVLPKYHKTIDIYSNLKHTERTIYNEALNYAIENNFDDAIVLNENNTIADAAIYNVFIIKDGIVYTSPLSDAPVAGVVRAFLLNNLSCVKIIEKSITIQDVYEADEVFVTNAIRGIRWVKSVDEKKYNNTITKQIFGEFKSIVSEQYGKNLI